ncbi:glycosyltransferase family protein [Butyrivibrio sp. YAB3001]|uniref:glycosyltransferase family protein n=1 Tax=Butyrivibrio sp. YAB3001 TaxID=1520812 RepID=UPI0008F62363|nr:glycosyltransferase [Butyrivibrio sp. YAB3001]SFB94292.1 Glycosyl transferases group 1 [Butyrivibrio sp. YAB3001]
MGDKLPILLFEGDVSLCYGILKSFSEQLRDAFLELGEEVIYLNPADAAIEDYSGRSYKAIIAFMENIFYSAYPDSKELIFDSFYGPKFNYWTDYPAFYHRHVKRIPQNYYILTQDRNYVKFIDHYYRGVKAFFLPPGGRKAETIIPFQKRKYALSFVGSFLDWREPISSFNSADETTKVIIDRYLDLLVTEPDLTTEVAFEKTLTSLGAKVSDEQFVQELAKVHKLADRGAARIYREEIIKTLIDNGITVDVFGDSWRNSPFVDNSYLRIHPSLEASGVDEIYDNSKMSLNVMTWHKDAITERVLDTMMAGCIAVSDQTPALREAFIDGEDLILYSLKEIERLPEIILKHSNNEKIAHNGMVKATERHSWRNRAIELLKIIDEMSC